MAQRHGLCVVSHAWLSPRCEAYLEVRARGRTLQRIRVSLADLMRGPKPFVLNGETGEYAKNYWSLAVSLMKRAEIRGTTTAVAETGDCELRA